MEQVFLKVYENWGWGGLALAYFLFDKFFYPKFMSWKKGDEYVSFATVKLLKEEFAQLQKDVVNLKNIQDRHGDHIKYGTEKLSGHLVQEEEENVKMGVMENKIVNIEKNQERTDANVEKIFGMISKVKDFMIEQGYGNK